MMKKLFAILAILLFAQTNCMAISYDTTVNVSPVSEIDADKVKVGDMVRFQTLDNIIYNGDIAFPEGTIVYGKVTKIKNNFIFGIPGILFVGDFEMNDKNGSKIKLSGNAVNMGQSRYWVNIPGILLCLPCLFIKGNDAKIAPTNQYTLSIP